MLIAESGAGCTVTEVKATGRKCRFVTVDSPYRGHVQMREHIYVAEGNIGRRLKRNECVHHIDDNPLNNNADNLRVMTIAEHQSLHMIQRYHTPGPHNKPK